MPFLKPLGTQLLLLTLSACLALPALAVSAYILHVYRTQHASNPWWLPVWRAHFDISGLLSVISASCLIFALDITSIGIIFGCKSTGLKNKIMAFLMAGLLGVSTVAALVAVIMPAVANSRSPSRSDTVQTWTCRWKGAVGAPENFGGLCRDSLFSSYAPIPLFIIHILLLAQATQDAIAATKTSKSPFQDDFVQVTKNGEVSVTESETSVRSEDV